MYNLEDITTIHLEVTSRCQASCPMCVRNIQGGILNPWLEEEDISIDQFKEWLIDQGYEDSLIEEEDFNAGFLIDFLDQTDIKTTILKTWSETDVEFRDDEEMRRKIDLLVTDIIKNMK
jgi:MoaA/NifB/PqqE/SkfB family radical SAM enzyme